MSRQTEVANILLQNEQEQILLLQRSPALKGAYLWGFPGGIRDPGEELTQTVLRELAEETGIEEYAIVISDTWRFQITSPEETIKLSLSRGRLNHPAPVACSPDEHIGSRWWDLDAVLNSADALPFLPTMTGLVLGLSQVQFVDHTITPNHKLEILKQS